MPSILKPQFRPLKAATLEEKDLDQLKYPSLFGSLKYDGIRAITSVGTIVSKRLKLIPNLELRSFFTSGMALDGLDGELICGDPCAVECYQRTQSAVMSHRSDDSKAVKFFLFDYIAGGMELPYWRRLEQLLELYKHLPGSIKRRVVLVEQLPITSRQAFDRLERESVAMGFEGIMVRGMNSPYKMGQSTLNEGFLMKFKRFVDGECRILGTYEQETNTNEALKNELGFSKRSSAKAGKVGAGTLGGFNVIDIKSGVTFDVATGLGLTAELRAELWKDRKGLVDRIIKYRFQPVGVKEKPRFPRFLGFRDPIDM